MRVAPLGDDSQRYIISLRDITALRLAERMRVDFVANASHELRTPLSTVMGFIETLQGAAADDSAARVRFLDIMGQEADRMSRLIDDLLSLSRVELDNQAPPSTPIELAPVLADVGKTLAVRLGADARSLKVSVPPDLPMVLADRDQILQVVHNLVSNSIKYGRAGTPIEIEADVAPAAEDGGADVIRVSVRDKGEGIAPEHLPRLTERFTGSTTRGRGDWAGPGSGWRSSSTFSSGIRERSVFPVLLALAPPSLSPCRSVKPGAFPLPGLHCHKYAAKLSYSCLYVFSFVNQGWPLTSNPARH
ncbi:hypothetical protein E6W36_07945 [Hankyongella ginsenosidimutans]|uniref:histidine kinase n=1 Tax=Hankyongella ginsenosidimutans TaxID=1763828 RepID=A0A4D7CC10_9SPHN|nr:histidine kinase dimerization/phospho-acceptor domain-containing protein [Hankyongella ginsenosidimutans]QCI79502.1 hypothetical protein E6W36_07945 [Hankyongella ginsenosidimutans]